MTLIDQHRGIQPHQMSTVNFHCRFGQREGDPLVFTDRVIETLTNLGVFKRKIQRPARKTDCPGCIIDAAERHAEKPYAESLVELSHELIRFDTHTIQHDCAFIPAGLAEYAPVRSEDAPLSGAGARPDDEFFRPYRK